jgi:threonine dehydrogenase-like Zn-dependent dehydrogenase
MKALTFEYSIPRYLLVGALARRWPEVLKSELAPVRLREVPDPVLPGQDWVKVRPRLAGLCGSDLSIILCRESLTLQPFASYPFVLGHEVSGEIAEAGDEVEDFREGDRVTVMPMLGCLPRGIDPPCRMCSQGRFSLCENFTGGRLAPGMFVGSNRDTPGFISEMGVAHRSQLYRVPEGLADENVVLVEPFSTALHMVSWNPVKEGETVMVIGCGVMGLCTIAALKALHPGVRVLAAEKDPFHAEVAVEMGADEVVRTGGKDFYRKVADLTGAKVFKPLMAGTILVGGVDRVFDTVGNTETLHASLRILAQGGWYNLLGISKISRIDWTPVWLKELTLRGIYGYKGDPDEEGSRGFDAFSESLRLMEEGRVDLSRMVTHRFRLHQWTEALEVAMDKGKHKAVKVAFVA